MKIAVLSDIHSNVIAFRACVEQLEKEKCEEYLFLGDYVSDTPYTSETMQFFNEFRKQHTCYVLRGNREEYMLAQRKAIKEQRSSELWKYNSASGNLLYSYEQLSEQDLDYFESLPITFRYEKEGLPAIICCHGSPTNTRELLQLEGKNTEEWLAKSDADYMLCAHTHYPGSREIYVGERKKYYFNSGSVGIAIQDFGFAQCMILENKQVDDKMIWQPRLLKIPYDVDRVIEDYFTTGLIQKAHWFINNNIHILRTGVDLTVELAETAKELSAKAGETELWPNIKEQYYEMAAKQVGIPDYFVEQKKSNDT